MFGFTSRPRAQQLATPPAAPQGAQPTPDRLSGSQVLQAVLFEGLSPDQAQRAHQDRLRQRAMAERQMQLLDQAARFAMGGGMEGGTAPAPVDSRAVTAIRPDDFTSAGYDVATPRAPPMAGGQMPMGAGLGQPGRARTGTSRDFLPFALAGAATGVPQLAEMHKLLSQYDPRMSENLMFGPDGRVMTPAGTPEALASIAAANARGTAVGGAPYQFETFTGPDGRPVVASREFMANQGPITGLSAADQDLVVIEVDGVPQQMTRAEASAFVSGRGGGSAASRGGVPGVPKRTEGQIAGEREYGLNQGRSAAARFENYQSTGQAARSTISGLNRLKGLYADVGGGRLAPAGKEIASVARSLGYEGFEGLGNMEAAEALGNDLALDMMGGSLGSGFSNADREFVTSMVPRLQMSPEGRAQLIDIGIARAEREVQVSDFARQWQQRYGRIDAPDRSGKTFEDYMTVWAERNSAFNQGAR